MRKTLHIVLLLCVAVACRGPRFISGSDMADILYDMLLADQMVRDDPDLRRQADSTLVYEAVFNRYGYDTDDYLYSLRVYLRDPERFARVLEKVGDRLQVDASSVEKVVSYHDWVAKYMNQKRPPVDSVMAMFSRDSLFAGAALVKRDEARYGGWFRLAAVREDTLSLPRDTVAVGKDTLAAGTVEEAPPSGAAPERPDLSDERPSRRIRSGKLAPREEPLMVEVEEKAEAEEAL